MFENSGIGSDPDLVDFQHFSGGTFSAQGPAYKLTITIDRIDIVGCSTGIKHAGWEPSDCVSVFLNTVDPQLSEFRELWAGKLICASNLNVKVGFHQDVVASGACVRESFDTKWSASSRLDAVWKVGWFLHLVFRGANVHVGVGVGFWRTV